MTKIRDLLDRVLRGESDANIDFDELRNLLIKLGFVERIRGSHHIFRRQDVEDRINLQSSGRHAKPYQVKQVRAAIVRYQLGSNL